MVLVDFRELLVGAWCYVGSYGHTGCELWTMRENVSDAGIRIRLIGSKWGVVAVDYRISGVNR